MIKGIFAFFLVGLPAIAIAVCGLVAFLAGVSRFAAYLHASDALMAIAGLLVFSATLASACYLAIRALEH